MIWRFTSQNLNNKFRHEQKSPLSSRRGASQCSAVAASCRHNGGWLHLQVAHNRYHDWDLLIWLFYCMHTLIAALRCVTHESMPASARAGTLMPHTLDVPLTAVILLLDVSAPDSFSSVTCSGQAHTWHMHKCHARSVTSGSIWKTKMCAFVSKQKNPRRCIPFMLVSALWTYLHE